MLNDKKHRLDLWEGDFGDRYHERNPVLYKDVVFRANWLRQVLEGCVPTPTSIFEAGCGNGANMAALKSCAPGVPLFACEPNENARAHARKYVAQGRLTDASVSQLKGFYTPGEFELVMTSGVLIHVPTAGLKEAMDALYDLSGRYILCAEYYSADEREVSYHDKNGALWTRPYGDLWLEAHPDLKPISYGFVWKRMDHLDNITWFLFEKPHD